MANIALVDDDKNILASVSMLLEQEGYHVRTFTDGASALSALTASPPDLAILDIKMPRMDGLELLRRLRQNADLPVIFLTSKDEEIDEPCEAEEAFGTVEGFVGVAFPLVGGVGGGGGGCVCVWVCCI